MLIGRKAEQQILRSALNSDTSEFVAVYGRRRIGKTFLIRETFDYRFTFQHTGLAKGRTKDQLFSFAISLRDAGYDECPIPQSWLEAFSLLSTLLKNATDEKKIVFLDELPWMDTARSGFLSAFEHFWNGWASARKDILLIICGSATSWIINKVINDHGGLHNRITRQIALQPFTLAECERYTQSRQLEMSRYQLAECYMILGGIPYYWSLLEKGKSLAQNIDQLFFQRNGKLAHEFDHLYKSLFKYPAIYLDIVTLLGQKKVGMTREELIDAGKLTNNGALSKALDELEYCGFIRKYNNYGNKTKLALYTTTPCSISSSSNRIGTTMYISGLPLSTRQCTGSGVVWLSNGSVWHISNKSKPNWVSRGFSATYMPGVRRAMSRDRVHKSIY